MQSIWERPGFLVRRLHQIHVALFLANVADGEVTPIQYALLFWRVPDTNRDLITRSLGTLEAIVLMVIGFYFGYSHWARTQKRQEGHT